MIYLKGPQLEDGYTRIANEILEVVSKVKFNGTQFKILMVIWRYTYGFNRKDTEFSLNFLSEATNCNKQQVKRELDKLIKSNVIIVIKEADFNSSRRLSFNKRYTEWKIDGIELIKKDTVSELAYSRVSELDYSTVSEKAYTTVSELAYQEKQYKENINKDIITTKESKQTKTGNPVADMDADSIQQDDLVAQIGAVPIKQDLKPVARVGAVPTKQASPVEKIEKMYLKIRNRNMCSSKDMMDIVEVYEKYKDIDFILSTMKTAAEENKARNRRLTINSFSYFIPIFQEKWEKLNLQKEGVKCEPTSRDSKKSIKFDKSKFLWNGG